MTAPSIAELISSYNTAQDVLDSKTILQFKAMFEQNTPAASNQAYRFTAITSATSFGRVWAGRGLYLILSNYQPPWERENKCSLTVETLPVLYRGQADKVQERLKSHLDNRRYAEEKRSKNQAVLERCLKLDEVTGNKGGINFEDAPFNGARWAVVVLPLKESTSQMRELVELAFDEAFGKPAACMERKVIPPTV